MRSRKVENLFYAGQYTHPGIGVPMVLIAAELAAGIAARS
jgi:phytoene desaturase